MLSRGAMGMAAEINSRWSAVALIEAPWRDPVEVAAAFADEAYALALLSDGSVTGRWSYVMRRPDMVLRTQGSDPLDPFAVASATLGPRRAGVDSGPPFQGGLAGLASYELGLRREPGVDLGRKLIEPPPMITSGCTR